MSPNRIASLAGAVLFAGVGGWGLVASLAPSDPAVGVLVAGVFVAGVFATGAPLAALHLGMAVALAVGALRSDRTARRINVAVGVLLLALGMLGLFVVGTPANVLGLNGADNVLHFAASSGLLATGLGAARRRSDA